jgi:hypothetical protein
MISRKLRELREFFRLGQTMVERHPSSDLYLFNLRN